MKKKIAILGSTGSIGKSTISIIKNNKKDFQILLLSTNKNISQLKIQCKKFKPKYIVVKDFKSFIKFKKKNKSSKFLIYNNYDFLKKNIKIKLKHLNQNIIL